jgi:hypothetical protein
MNYGIVRQSINAAWAVIVIALVITFAWYIFYECCAPGWRKRVRVQAAFALFGYFSGEALGRIWGSVWLYYASKGKNLWVIEEKYPIALAGAFLAFGFGTYLLKIFSPPSWGHKGWIITVIVIIATIVVITIQAQ